MTTETTQRMVTLTVDQALREAILHHQNGKLEDAARLYRAILQIQPNHPDANHNLGMLAVQMKQPSAGLLHLKTALEANPRHGQYWLSYIDALIQTGKLDVARHVLEQGRLQGLQGESIERLSGKLGDAAAVQPAAIECAIAHREAGRYKEALHVLQSQLDGNRQDAGAYALLAQVLSLDKQDGPAWTALNRALSINPALPVVQRNHARLLLKKQETDEALEAAQAAYKTDASDPENQLVLAAALGSNGRVEQAFLLIASVLQSCPDYADAYATRSVFKRFLNDLTGALADAEKALSIKPHLGQLWGIVSSLRYQLKDLPGAIAALERALGCEPDSVDYLINLGELKRQAGQDEAAIVMLEKAVAIAPENVAAWVNLGTALQESRRVPEAKAAYTRALALAPEQAEVANNLGNLAMKEENWEEALRYFNQSLEREPENIETYNNLGVILHEQGRFPDAEACYRRALEIRPDYAEAQNNLGGALQEQGRLSEAEASYRVALEHRPDFAKALLNLGSALCDLDNLHEAAGVYQKALAVGRLDAAVYLAILCYLGRNLNQCRQMLLVSQPIMTNTDRIYTNSRNYWFYLNKLLSWHQSSVKEDNKTGGMCKLYVIGDSNSLSAHGMVVRYQEKEMHCTAEWIIGCKQWHLGNDKTNKYKYKFEAVMKRLPRKSTILLTFGEIDCRHDDGIIEAWKKKQDKTLAEVMRTTVDRYINYVAAVANRYEDTIIVGGVQATNISLTGC